MLCSKFEIDKQTLIDLAIFPSESKHNSVLQLFDFTITYGGKSKLRQIFNTPLTNTYDITDRVEALEFLQMKPIQLNLHKGECDFIEHYLNQSNKPNKVSKFGAVQKRINYYFTKNHSYYTIYRGIIYSLKLLETLNNLNEVLSRPHVPKLFREFNHQIQSTLDGELVFLKTLFNKEKLSAIQVEKADYLLRTSGLESIKQVIDITYQLDVLTTISLRGKVLGFTLPFIVKSDERILQLKGFFHPFINEPVSNDIEFSQHKNVCFVTGTNMAGKSSLLKSIGISVYLSQLGFPVPASKMITSGFMGLITTINVPDDIEQGNSHFYAEVARIKHVALMMDRYENMVVIFDELFRGTNVKDAYDASLAVITAFAELKYTFFIISTHIVEVAFKLKKIKNINFKFLETLFDNGYPKFNYKLQDGITEEKLGMWIVKNEGIVEMIEKTVKKRST